MVTVKDRHWARTSCTAAVMISVIRILRFALVVSLAGCANLNSVHHEFSSGESDLMGAANAPRVKSVSVDAQQRFLVMNFATDMWRVCAEPSPDALSALSGGGGASVSSKSEAAASLAASFAQQAAAYGLRTQSITTLRDEAFRLCEGFANKALDSRTFDVLHRRFLNNMVAELAIEQLTGYARPTVVTIGGGATGTSGGGLPQAQAALDEANKQLAAKQDDAQSADKSATDAQVAYDAAKKAADAATKASSSDASSLTNTAEAKKVDLDKAQTDQIAATQAVTDAKKNVGALTTARDAARSVTSGATSSSAQFSVPVAGAAITGEVAAAVSKIVHDVIYRDYAIDNCLDYIGDSESSLVTQDGDSPAYTAKKRRNPKGTGGCEKITKAYTDDLQRASRREADCLDYLVNKEGKALDSDVKKMCIDVVTSASNSDNHVADVLAAQAALINAQAAKTAADAAAKAAANASAGGKAKANAEPKKETSGAADAGKSAAGLAAKVAPTEPSSTRKSKAAELLEKYNTQ